MIWQRPAALAIVFSTIWVGMLSFQGLLAPGPAGAAEVFTQQPEVMPAVVGGREEPAVAAGAAARQKLFSSGPTPQWIWGADQNQVCFLRRTFQGGSKEAWLKAACDNHMVLWLNGREIARGDDWQSPVEIDVQKYLKEGENVLLAEVRNEGGPAGFVLKLALAMPDDKPRYVVSDSSWQAAAHQEAKTWAAATKLAALGSQPWGDVFAHAPAGGPTRGLFQTLPGFQVERLFIVPKEQLGSWVCLALDDQGRILASDQEGRGLCRITPPPPGSSAATRVERLDVRISAAQGMLHAFGSLYLSVNGGPGSGLYRASDTNGDDQYDQVEKLEVFRGGGEHGPHALRLAPDGKSIYVICGNHTDPPGKINASRIPQNWGEDLLLPRQWDANGHALGRMAPGGWIARTDPDGKTWEIISIGYRNAYDMDFNADGELFAYDADMEWDFGTPWYRPTRVNHAVSGSEFGWRSGTGKWPPYYVDSLPPMIDIGPGSPVGVTFGYGAKFPAQYQRALYILDWTFGTIYAIHLEPHGASYKAAKEEFLSRTPLPLTDAVVGRDGALYFAIGGRGTQSELYRVTYRGNDSTAPVDARDPRHANLRSLRQQLEAWHTPEPKDSANEAQAIEFIWHNLAHGDRFIRYAARVALEHRAVRKWQDRVQAEANPDRLLGSAVALARQGDKTLQPGLLAALDRLSWESLNERQQLDLLRCWSLVFIRMGPPNDKMAAALAAKLDRYYPAASDDLNRELCNLLVYLKSPTVVSKTIALLRQETRYTPEEISDLLSRNPGYGNTIKQVLANHPDVQKLHYAFALRNLRQGWKLEERVFYFRWLQEAAKKSGGASYQGFLRNIGNEAYENASDTERLAVEAAGARQPYKPPELPLPMGPGRDWTVSELVSLAEGSLKGRNFENGKRMYAAARCIVCHRFAGEGGATGHDLTQAAGRFTLKDLCEAMVEPGKVVSDQYQGVVVVTSDGKSYTGRIVSQSDESTTFLVDPEDATKVVTLRKDQIEQMMPSQVSLMPSGLLKPLGPDEVLDLLAYILSRGNRNDPMFR
jgi:putative heme-binding domain-containing protein